MNAPLPSIQADRRGVFHPASVEEVADLVRLARARHLPVRVVGAGRSRPDCIWTDPHLAGRLGEGVDISLDRVAHVRFHDDGVHVTAGAGCRLAWDPRDRTGRSTPWEALCPQLDARGLALPILTGGNVQTVGGLIVSGSDGGSLRHAIGEAVAGLTVVDGTGAIHELRPGDGLFEAAGVSLGLLGVLVEVTFRCEPRYDIAGEEAYHALPEAPLGLAPGRDPGELLDFLRDREYARVMWWPQPDVQRTVSWSARRLTAAESAARRGPDGRLERRPYRELPEVLGSTFPVQAAGGLWLAMVGQWPRWFHAVAGESRPARLAAGALGRLAHPVKGRVFRLFVSGDEPQRFVDDWWRGLAMDQQVDERLMPTDFTELWVPLSRAEEAVERLRRMFRDEGHAATGDFVTELYGGRRSPFWLSPAHGEDALRVNVFWPERHLGDPVRDFYPRFWDLLEPLGARYHWSKALPPAERLGAGWFRERYPRFDDFLDARARLDPDGLFLSDYWRTRLGLPAPRRPGPEPVAVARAEAPRSFPLLFQLEPLRTPEAGGEAGEPAELVFDNHAVVRAPIERAYEVCARPVSGEEWITLFRGADWLVEPFGRPGDAVVETFAFMSARLRVIEAEPPRRVVAGVDACSLPLGRSMTSEWRLEPLDPDHTAVRWTVRVRPLSAMRPLLPLLRPFFAWMFRSTTAALETWFEGAEGGERTGRA